MNEPQRSKILIIDDEPDLVDTLEFFLPPSHYQVFKAYNGEEALTLVEQEELDLILLDINMPKMNGHEVCLRIKDLQRSKFLPIIMMSGHSDLGERVQGLNEGACHFVCKPFSPEEIVANIEAFLRIKALQDEATEIMEHQLQAQSNQVTMLKRFFQPQIADLAMSPNAENKLKVHRNEISVAFIDLRGFTAFTDSVQPEQVIEVLTDYYRIVGDSSESYRGTLGHLAGDGVMVFFNDPTPVENHRLSALEFVLDVRNQLLQLEKQWSQKGYKLSFGAGVASGMATIGAVGCSNLINYTVVGNPANLAARLCEQAAPGQVLISSEDLELLGLAPVKATPLPAFTAKGFKRKIIAFDVEILRLVALAA